MVRDLWNRVGGSGESLIECRELLLGAKINVMVCFGQPRSADIEMLARCCDSERVPRNENIVVVSHDGQC